MGLAEVQAALARLYTSADAREALSRDPRHFEKEHGLSHEETGQLAGSVLKEADDFARALGRKRFSEAMKAIPDLEKLFEFRIDSLFATYAAATPLGSQRNPALDALCFTRWLLRTADVELSSSDRDAVRYQEARLSMQQTGRRLLVRWLLVPDRGNASRSVAIWWRWRGRLWHWVSD